DPLLRLHFFPTRRSSDLEGGMDVARIKLNDAALLCNRLVPMSKPPLERCHRFDHISAVRKTFLRLLEFRQRAGVIALCVITVIADRKSTRLNSQSRSDLV